MAIAGAGYSWCAMFGGRNEDIWPWQPVPTSINQYISQFLQHGNQYHYQIYQPIIITSINIRSQYEPLSVAGISQ